MGVITSENFDGVTAPTLPAGWTAAAAVVTETASFNSSPNGVHNPVNITKNFIYNSTLDGNGGDARNTVLCWATAVNIACAVSVYCRVTAVATTSGTTETGYWVQIDFVGNGVSIQKTASGATGGALAARTGPTFGITDKYYVTCETVGTLITCRIQRLSDSKWLDTSNAWQVAQQDYLTATDSSIAGAGKCMVGLNRFNTSDHPYFDDLLFETVGSGPTTRRMTQVISF